MNSKQKREYDKQFNNALKSAVKSRKMKLSAQSDIFKKIDPYFYNTFYYISRWDEENVEITLKMSLKYIRFDELQYSIIKPNDSTKFTDKLRANSGMQCHSEIEKIVLSYEYQGVESFPEICVKLLDWIENYYSNFLAMVEKEYGDLNGYYIANKEKSPRLAGLAYLDQGNKEEAAKCFASINESSNDVDGIWSVDIDTQEQRQRVLDSNNKIFIHTDKESIWRTRVAQFNDYAIALENNLEWTNDRAMYGLLVGEREKKIN